MSSAKLKEIMAKKAQDTADMNAELTAANIPTVGKDGTAGENDKDVLAGKAPPPLSADNSSAPPAPQATQKGIGDAATDNYIDPNVTAETIAAPLHNQNPPLMTEQRAADPAQDAMQNDRIAAVNQRIDGSPIGEHQSVDALSQGMADQAVAGRNLLTDHAGQPLQAVGMQSSAEVNVGTAALFPRAGYGQVPFVEYAKDELSTVKKGQFLNGNLNQYIDKDGNKHVPLDGVFLPVDEDMENDLRHMAKRNLGIVYEGTAK